MREMFGAFTYNQWTEVYRQAYENLVPGVWIEQVEPGIRYVFLLFRYLAPTMLNIAYLLLRRWNTTPDSLLAALGPISIKICAKTPKNIDTLDQFRQGIETAGFTYIHERRWKILLCQWAKNPVFKEAGNFHKAQLLAVMEGYAM